MPSVYQLRAPIPSSPRQSRRVDHTHVLVMSSTEKRAQEASVTGCDGSGGASRGGRVGRGGMCHFPEQTTGGSPQTESPGSTHHPARQQTAFCTRDICELLSPVTFSNVSARISTLNRRNNFHSEVTSRYRIVGLLIANSIRSGLTNVKHCTSI